MTTTLLFTPTREPRAHQWRALELARGRAAFAYFLEMGVGKSKVAIDEMIQLYLEKTIEQVLIVAGAGSYADWMHKHMPENVPSDVTVSAHLWDGGHSKTEQERLRCLMMSPHLRVLIMNIEALGSSDTAQTVADNFVRVAPTLFVVDESSKIKNEDAQRTVIATRLARKCPVKRILTGSPVTKNPMDLWGQLQFLGIEQEFATNYYSFRARYCTLIDVRVGTVPRKPGSKDPPKQKFAKKITGYQNLDKLERMLGRHSLRVLKEECLDLPPKIYEEYQVELTNEQKRLYKQMSLVATAEIKEGVWGTARNAMGRLAKMHQIVLGHLVDEQGEVHGIETNRPAALCDLVEEARDKVIVWCAYRRDVSLVLDELKRRFPERKQVRYDGLVPRDERPGMVDAFVNGDAQCFVGTAATGGHGLTLTVSNTTIYYSNSDNLEYRLQSEDRAHRDGQTRSVTYVDMISPRTVEVKIVQNLRAKRTMAESVMGDEITEWLAWMDK